MTDINNPRMTDKMATALLAAYQDPTGYLPAGTSGVVLGRLYRLGYANREQITPNGRTWVEANRLPEMEG